MNADLLSKLQKILALTTSPVEGEAQAATAMLQRLLTQHNLDMADLEQKGAHAPTIEEKGHDLGKAAFKWKLDLAEVIASHFYCHSIVNRSAKTVVFLGRPDNVESMKMLYGWLIEQIRQISAAKRKEHQAETGEHVDPLRWQVSFGVGLVSRLGDRLQAIKQRREQEEAERAGLALVLHHQSEISDYTEAKYGWRTDGRKTAQEQRWAAEWVAHRATQAAADAAWKDLLATDPEAAYAQRPWERPKTEAELKREAKAQAKEDAKRRARWAREDQRAEERERNMTPEQRRAKQQAADAQDSGARSAKDVNLEPFLTNGPATPDQTKLS